MVLNRTTRKVLIAATPVTGAIAFALLVPLLMTRVSLSAGIAGAVTIGTLWFVAMLRTSEMPSHH